MTRRCRHHRVGWWRHGQVKAGLSRRHRAQTPNHRTSSGCTYNGGWRMRTGLVGRCTGQPQRVRVPSSEMWIRVPFSVHTNALTDVGHGTGCQRSGAPTA